MKALVGAFNQEKALVVAFSVIVQLHRLIVYTALPITHLAGPRPHVDGLGVGDGRELGGDAAGLRGHGEQRGDAQRHAGRHRLGVEPEVDPGDDDEHAARHVDRDQVVGELPLEHQVHRQAAVLTWCETEEYIADLK